MNFTSQTDAATSLISQLSTANRLRDETVDDSWMTYLYDHKNYIRANSIRRMLSKEDGYKYRYRAHSLLATTSGADHSILAFCIANNFKDENDLNEHLDDTLYIPKAVYISELKMQYRTLQSRKKSAKLTRDM